MRHAVRRLTRPAAPRARLVLLVAALAAPGCGTSGPPAGSTAVALAGGAEGDSILVPDAALDRARQGADTLGARLMARLREELRAGGPAAAVAVCAEAAPAFTAELQEPDRTVRRVSTRWRTPRDRPDGFETAALEAMTAAVTAGGEPAEVLRVEEGPEGRWLRYMRPIRAVGMCLQCHGPPESLDPEVRAFLAERYPDDRATGHAEGDLRGAFSVRVRLDGTP